MSLKKVLTVLDVFSISTGAMLSGVFILPALAYETAGSAVLVSYLIAGALALTGLLSQAELASAMPKAGGTYFYVTRSMGSAVGTVYGLITWLAIVLKSAFELVFMSTAIIVLGHLNQHLMIPLALVLCCCFIALNIFGVKEAGRMQTYIVLVILGALVVFVIKSFGYCQTQNFSPFNPNGFSSIFATAGLVFISFGGLLKVASVAEEVKDPGKTLPRAMLMSLAVVQLSYLLIIFMLIGEQVTPGILKTMLFKEAPISQTANLVMGNGYRIFFAIIAILAVISAVNSGIMAASRYPLALSRDKMLPPWLGNISSKFETPINSLILTGIVIAIALFFDIKVLVKAASCVLIMTYIFTNAAVVILRESKVQNYRPQFKSPLYPWVQVIGALGLIALMAEMGPTPLFVSLGLALLGFVVYWFYGRQRASQEYALLHLIGRITAQEFTSHSLERELKDIIHERDEVLKDGFDRLVESCPVMDIAGPLTRDEFFGIAADVIGEDLGIEIETVLQSLIQREQQGCTALSPLLAIPHIVIPGEKHFDVLMFRCSEGIHFSAESTSIKAVIVLIGTRDQRRGHLMALAAIAQIVQEDDFSQRWLKAKNPEALRDLILLGKRQRQIDPAG
ncbi:MAG: amino acid permease [Phycisphaerae bacterium]|nr:amino acid permease [Phycisphaerae bacterium]